MATQRLHKILFDKTTNHFAAVKDHTGAALDVNAASVAVNPAWPPYSAICAETHELLVQKSMDGSDGGWVLRGTTRCCCAGACHYASDHAGENAYAKVAAAPPGPATLVQTKHGPSQQSVESSLAAADLAALVAQGRAAAADQAARAALARALAQDATIFALSASEVEADVGVEGVDANGLLSAAGATALVLAGTSTSANDYYVIAAFLKLYQRLVYAVHQRLSRDWPQRMVHKPITLGPRQAGGAQ